MGEGLGVRVGEHLQTTLTPSPSPTEPRRLQSANAALVAVTGEG